MNWKIKGLPHLATLFLFGMLLENSSKALDGYGGENPVLVLLRDALSGVMVWVLLAVLIALLGSNTGWALGGGVSLCGGMLTAYITLSGREAFQWAYFKGWAVFILLLPLCVLLACRARRRDPLGILLACGIPLGALAGVCLLQGGLMATDIVCLALAGWLLLRKPQAAEE